MYQGGDIALQATCGRFDSVWVHSLTGGPSGRGGAFTWRSLGFDSLTGHFFAPEAQLDEQRVSTSLVASSSLARRAILKPQYS